MLQKKGNGHCWHSSFIAEVLFVVLFLQVNVPEQNNHQSKQEETREMGGELAVLEKPFIPPCTVKHKDALSALKRVKSDSCKRLIYKTACLSEANMLLKIDVKRSCPVPRDKGSPAKTVDPTRTAYGSPIRIAYVLTLHGRAFRQVKRLFKALYHNNHYFFFHIDTVSMVYLWIEESYYDLYMLLF